MEFTAYQLVSENTASLNTGSYLNRTESSLFVGGYTSDLWYGFSANDAIEFGVWDRENNLIGWNVLNQSKSYTAITRSYLDAFDFPITYSYLELNQDFILYKNESILVNPSEQLSSSFGLQDGSYVFVYNYTREMAGNVQNPLIIKEISPSRREIKLIPINGSTLTYEAFCKKKVLVQDLSPLYLQAIKGCQTGQIYGRISSLYPNEINTIKSVFFLNTDGAMVNFLRNLYDDVTIYTTNPVQTSTGPSSISGSAVRIQGIQTFFSNYLLSNSNNIVDFVDIDNAFNGYVSASIERKFSPIGKHPSIQYVQAKSFVYDFFTKYFYQPISNVLTQTYKDKYLSSLKNALNFDNNRLLPILDHGYMDERESPDDPLTLLVKLQSELSADLTVQTSCRVSNISLSPYVINAIVKNPTSRAAYKIGPPDFSIPIPDASLTNTNMAYTSADLEQDDETNRELTVSKKIGELTVDYTLFENFVVFSSAELRLNIFKNKIINISSLSSSLQILNEKNVNFLSTNGITYPFYTQEVTTFQGQLNDIINSFDGYESYLYRNGSFTYSAGTFISSSFISDLQSSANEYDKNNRDSLINNCPEHILTDSSNDEYIIFLSMIGHFFDEIYSYISCMPSEKKLGHSATETFTRRIVDYMLESFGWNLDDSLEQSNLINNYLNSEQMEGLNQMSSEDRLKEIRSRILINLPRIYKTKGTEESVRTILACYGIPSSLLSIREYGGVNYTDDKASYTTYERSFMYQWDTSSRYDQFRTAIPTNCKTFLVKFCVDNSDQYVYGREQNMIGSVDANATQNSASGSGDWALGFVREPGPNMGKLYFRIGYDNDVKFKINSPTFPLFDGNIYSVMLRRNPPADAFEFNSDADTVPTTFDLYVQRNEFGNQILRLTSSTVSYDVSTNNRFSSVASGSYLMIGGWFADRNQQGFTGAMDKLQVWYDPITDGNFEDYVNSINAYSFSGSRLAHQSLVFRMHTDYPFDLRQIPPGTTIPSGYDGLSGTYNSWVGQWRNANPFYASNSLNKQEKYLSPSIASNSDLMINKGAWSGSTSIVYDSASCGYVSQSVYPFQFKIIDYPSTWGISKYGPNKFRNEKVRHITQSIAARFDDKDRSTYISRTNMAPDSNQVGFFADPQDFKNKDIVRYFGNFDFMDSIGAPYNQYSSSYQSLNVFRKEYASSLNEYSSSKTLFNELITLYKLYFNRSIFEAIKNVVPSRCNTLVGVLIEPSILERPKYPIKPIYGESNTGSVFYADITASRYFRDFNTKLCRISESLLFADFNVDTQSVSNFDARSLPNNLTIDLNLSYLNLPNQDYPVNYLPNGTYVPDVMDNYQLGHFAGGVVPDPTLIPFPPGTDFTTGEIIFDMNETEHPIVSQSLYLLKRWKKYSIYAKSSSYTRTDNPSENLYSTSSVYLYDYIVVSKDFYSSIVYTSSLADNTPAEFGTEVGTTQWTHRPGTFRNSPNALTNNYLLRYNPLASSYITSLLMPDRPRYGYVPLPISPLNTPEYQRLMSTPIPIDQGEYFEVVHSYPRNHLIHKSELFSLFTLTTYGKELGSITSGSYKRCQQTVSTTIGDTGLEDGSSPVQSSQVGNLNLVQSDNVINK